MQINIKVPLGIIDKKIEFFLQKSKLFYFKIWIFYISRQDCKYEEIDG